MPLRARFRPRPTRLRGRRNADALRAAVDELVARGSLEPSGPGRVVWQTAPGRADLVFEADCVYQVVQSGISATKS